ncbi:MAG: amino acid racemase [Patescibacteria group bacterium]|nr:amino acid racemase [Patescibacteria group bacterium]
MKTIGILGGMGPRATVVFERMLLDALPGSDQDLPTIITINDGSIPDRSNFILGIGPDPIPRMQRNVASLEHLGADVICIPCNTACTPVLFDRLVAENSQLFNLPILVVERLVEQKCKKVCLLATSGTVASKTYQTLCKAQEISCLVPSRGTQAIVMQLISAIKGGYLAKAQRLARRVARNVAIMDCDAVILGCTELPLLADQLVPINSRGIDTLAVLVDACVRYSNYKGETHGNRFIYA